MATLSSLIAAEVRPYGYRASAAGAFLPTEKGRERVFFFQNWPDGWTKLYQDRNFIAHDFIVTEACRRMAPVTWSEVVASRALDLHERAVERALVEWGWTEGFAAPFHGPGGYLGLMLLAGDKQPLCETSRARLHALLFWAHGRCRALTGLDVARRPHPPLSERERVCLGFVAHGLSDTEIAAELGVSQTTAHAHVENAKRKLGAKTRAQAVMRLFGNTSP